MTDTSADGFITTGLGHTRTKTAQLRAKQKQERELHDYEQNRKHEHALHGMGIELKQDNKHHQTTPFIDKHQLD